MAAFLFWSYFASDFIIFEKRHMLHQIGHPPNPPPSTSDFVPSTVGPAFVTGFYTISPHLMNGVNRIGGIYPRDVAPYIHHMHKAIVVGRAPYNILWHHVPVESGRGNNEIVLGVVYSKRLRTD
jgi:hypothetical protein